MESGKNPKISVIMGIYNCAPTLPDAIESITAQTYTDWELIMCDDGSTDNTYEVADSYRQKYPDKIILIKNEQNSGLAFSLNHCLKYATGKYVARMDGDDKCVPERFEKQLAFLEANPQYDVVGTSMQRFNDEGLADIVHARLHPDYNTLKTGSPFNHATILMKKEVYDALDGYIVSEKTRRCEDCNLWARFYKQGFQGENIDEPLYFVKEDMGAIKRRTPKSRIDTLGVILECYRLLDYPKSVYVKTILITFCKICTPFFVQKIYRNIQAKK